MIVDRRELRDRIASLLSILLHKQLSENEVVSSQEDAGESVQGAEEVTEQADTEAPTAPKQDAS